MKLLHREVRPDEVEQDVTQRDQFNTDEVGLGETLVREAHQNTMDGRSLANTGAVRTRIQLVSSEEDEAFWSELLEPLRPHLEHSGIELSGISLAQPQLLVIEDFGTTGLLGEVDRKDERNFSDFWRRMGRSHKQGSQGGRWGLGKLVFSSASRIRTFFGLTIRDDDPERRPYLMGQAVLKNHEIEGKVYAPHIFFGESAPDGLQVPVEDAQIIGAFRKAAGLARGSEPGLSIVIPYVQADITPTSLLPFVIRNWFFPIVTGRLVIEIGEHVIDANSFDDLAKQHGGPELQDGRLIAFIRNVQAAGSDAPTATLQAISSSGKFENIDEAALASMREQYTSGGLVTVRIPLTLRRKAGLSEPTFLEAHLKAAPEQTTTNAIFVRGALTLPGESRGFRGRGCFAALIAKDTPVVEFLGDAETPAHTRWIGTAEKLVQKWSNPSARLREIRAILNALFDLIVESTDRVDEDALLDVFSIRDLGVVKQHKSKKPIVRKPLVPVIPVRPAAYRINPHAGGFQVVGGDPDQLPLIVRIKVAYDVIRGDALGRYSPYDFDLNSGSISIHAEGADCTAPASNELRIEAYAADFRVVVSGFDSERDLFLRANRQ